ncbi:MAG: M67 family metallopeptidase [Sphingomonadaceae bacterium]|nr:M67 family metallopeptidase [Sphingomonadaceae bacterium]
MTISRAAHRAILTHAAQTPDIEVCGLLLGSGNAIERADPAANVAADPAESFEIDPQALFSNIRAEREGGMALIGAYHSHPSGASRPSERDHAMALDVGRLWLIVAKGEMTAWRAEKPGHLIPVELSLASGGGQRQ